MVVICGAVPSMVRSVRLFSHCSHRYVNVFPNGTVMATSDANDQPNLTISTSGVSLELLIHSPIHNMYLCFNRHKVIGRRMSRARAEKNSNCLFKEEFLEGYNRYHLAKNKSRYIGFNRQGFPLKLRPWKKYHGMCFSFMKVAHDFDIGRHNDVLSGGSQRRRAPTQNDIKAPRHHIRHRHDRHQGRRKNCSGT